MITLAEAEEIAAGWARLETGVRGYECTAVVAEFDLGYVVWTRRPGTETAEPGDGGRTVIDREIGLVTTWPAVPVETVVQLYRERHPDLSAQRRTVDPSVELLRGVRRRYSPTTAAHLTVDGRVFRARGAKGDQQINHHPLIDGMFRAAAPHGELVRGCERHAELIVLSDALHEAERARSEPLTLETAREALRGARSRPSMYANPAIRWPVPAPSPVTLARPGWPASASPRGRTCRCGGHPGMTTNRPSRTASPTRSPAAWPAAGGSR